MEQPRDENLIGKYIGSYLIKETLGEGSYGTVYLGIHPTIERKAAIKVLNHKFSHNQEITARFIAEAKAVNKISHPNIIQVFDFGALDDGRLFYVMEYVDGKELSQILDEEGALDMGTVNEVFNQLAQGLDEAHASGIIHRDLKPGNIIVSRTARGINLKIFDFGIAKLLETNEADKFATGAGEIMGTPAYMSPEQARADKSKIGRTADIYSLGVIVYQMLSGVLPINHDDSIADLISAILHLKPHLLKEIISGIPEGMSEVVDRALEKEPEGRYQWAGEFYQDFKRTLFNPLLTLGPNINTAQLQYVTNEAGELVLTPSGAPLANNVHPPLHPAKIRRRSTFLYFLAAVAFLSFIGVGTFVAYRKRQARAADESQLRSATWEVTYLKVGNLEYGFMALSDTRAPSTGYSLHDGVVRNGDFAPVVDLKKIAPDNPLFPAAVQALENASGVFANPEHLCHPAVREQLLKRKKRPLFIHVYKTRDGLAKCLEALSPIPLYLRIPDMGGPLNRKAIASLKHIRGLFLNNAKLGSDDFEAILTMVSLHTLSLNSSVFRQEDLRGLASLSSLRALYLRSTRVRDEDCSYFAGLKQLSVLSLDHSKVGDACIALLRESTGLRQLHLLGTKVTDASLRTISSFSDLEQLSLSYTRITPDGISSLAKLTSLVQLSLGGTRVNDSSLAYIGGLQKLERLYLYSSKVTNAGLIHIARLSRLRELYLDGTRITDTGLEILRWHLDLRVLSLSGCRISLVGLLALKRLSRLESINIKNTRCSCECLDGLNALLPDAEVTSMPCPKDAPGEKPAGKKQ